MKKLIRAEAIVPFLISLLLITALPINISWWMWVPVFLLPDLSMLGYLISNKAGAISYNIFHHQLLAVVIAGSGYIFHQPYIELTGLVLLGHSSLDRLLGYGLKLENGFNYTHLGRIGKSENNMN
jgi:Domain of unknown function (DUF4260)